ncbi:hypothetical protein [Pseudomonas sp. B21-053]|uniref:hypothetical protein n=1 Tax=Pseudomonas sp. B21-053 TaxID=2895493 RepID=UPI0022329B65|nr:hypothetical protein [Pseudomonas sp. B21-053]UZE09809.1 hypothetical protein LOY68_20075 [Pseudomonas sp. B21-053]
MTRKSKPRHDEMKKKVENYSNEYSGVISEIERAALLHACLKSDHVIRAATTIAFKRVPTNARHAFIYSFSIGSDSFPAATQIESGQKGQKKSTFRISVPIAFVHNLLKNTPTKGGLQPQNIDDYYFPSILIATLAAYAHELVHIIVGHLPTQESKAQELYADRIGGGTTWGWILKANIQQICEISSTNISSNCLYGFLHLASALNKEHNKEGLYLPVAGRFAAFCSGAIFLDESKGKRGLHEFDKLLITGIKCPDSRFQSDTIQNTYTLINSKEIFIEEELLELIKQEQVEKPKWFNASQMMAPIRRALQQIAKRNTSEKQG